jgi:hypothetical protein
MSLGEMRRSTWTKERPPPVLKPITAKTISVVVTTFTRCGYKDDRLFSMLGDTLMAMPTEEFSPQSLSLVMMAYTRHGTLQGELGQKLVNTCLALPEGTVDGQAAADMITAMSRASVGRDAILRLVSQLDRLNRTSLYREGRHYGAGGGVISALVSSFASAGVIHPTSKTLDLNLNIWKSPNRKPWARCPKP